MNNYDNKMVRILTKLKEKYGVIAVKSDFEAEGSSIEEIIRLKEIISFVGLKSYIKIGGCEAVRDLRDCKLLNADGIIVPMAESGYALQKFRNAAIKIFGKEEVDNKEWIINAETILAADNFADILGEARSFATGVTVGRVDLAGSMGFSRDYTDSLNVFNIQAEMLRASRKAHLITGFGGGVSLNSIDYIQRSAQFCNRFETRKVVFELENTENDFLQDAILLAMEFESTFMCGKRDYLLNYAHEDDERIRMIQNRISDYAQ